MVDIKPLNAAVFIVDTNGEARLDRPFAKRGIMKTGRPVERVIRECDSVYGKGLLRSALGRCWMKIFDDAFYDRTVAASKTTAKLNEIRH